MKKTNVAILLAVLTAMVAMQLACHKAEELSSNYQLNDETLSGGAETAFDQGSGAFSHAFSGMSAALERVHEIGDVQFNATFVSAPAPVNPGLGPIFNNVSCGSCHVSDGRGKIPGLGESAANMLFRLSLPGNGVHGGPVPVPGYGDQLQPRALVGVMPEGDVSISYTDHVYQFADGVSYSLREPLYTFKGLYMPMPGNVLLSPRVAAPIFGLGLLEALSENTILANADPDDKDGDGISGKPNYVWDVLQQKTVLGRFGWKANQPSLLQQTAAAYNGDMGITSFLFPAESSQGQTQFDSAPNSKSYELSDSLLYSTHFYIRSLAVPARRKVTDATVINGKALFAKAGCDKCHKTEMRTAVDVSFPAVSNQLIHPYTDLLLHDMGPGLADNRPDFQASGSEWRTPPLWGIGLTQKVNGHTNFLHDGRARDLMEAIMWHGGEAQAASNKVSNFTKAQRDALIAFLNSL